MNTEIQTINNLLSNPEYILTSEDIETETVLLALKTQQSIKPKYKAREYIYEYEDKIIPPAYQPNKEEVDLAMARYAIEDSIWEIIYYMRMHIDALNGKEPSFPHTKEEIEKSCEKYLERWDKAMDKWNDDNEIWECLVDREWFEKCYVDSLSDMHSGDCTAFASSCLRCHAEKMFNIPYTANWGKSEGNRIFNEYMKKKPITS